MQWVEFLLAWKSFVDRGFYYCNEGPWRMTGERGCVDCSGGDVLALNMIGIPTGENNSFTFSQQCHRAPRPQWMLDRYGPDPYTGSRTIGTGLTAEQANELPASWAFHGLEEGQLYGVVGHIKRKYFITRPGDPNAGPNVSIEAMSHALGVRYAHFLDPECAYFAWPWMLDNPFPESLEDPMPMAVACTNKKPNKAGQKPYAVLILPSVAFPRGVVLCMDGASIAGDQPTKNPSVRTWFPPALLGKLTMMFERPDRKGVILVDDQGKTTQDDGGRWS